jgi:hypothetical protein
VDLRIGEPLHDVRHVEVVRAIAVEARDVGRSSFAVAATNTVLQCNRDQSALGEQHHDDGVVS